MVPNFLGNWQLAKDTINLFPTLVKVSGFDGNGPEFFRKLCQLAKNTINLFPTLVKVLGFDGNGPEFFRKLWQLAKNTISRSRQSTPLSRFLVIFELRYTNCWGDLGRFLYLGIEPVAHLEVEL